MTRRTSNVAPDQDCSRHLSSFLYTLIFFYMSWRSRTWIRDGWYKQVVGTTTACVQLVHWPKGEADFDMESVVMSISQWPKVKAKAEAKPILLEKCIFYAKWFLFDSKHNNCSKCSLLKRPHIRSVWTEFKVDDPVRSSQYPPSPAPSPIRSGRPRKRLKTVSHKQVLMMMS